MARIRHASLFTGIGGFDLAAEWMGWDNVFQVEKDSYCQRVLQNNFPKTALHGDIKGFYAEEYRGAIDVISGGFPCQPFSHAGKRRGTSDDRYLWEEMLGVIREVRPSIVVGENVNGIIGLALDTVLTDLESAGYTCEVFVLPACSVGAPHQRNRVWIVAHSLRGGRNSHKAEWRKFIHDIYGLHSPAQRTGRQQQCGTCQSGAFYSDSNRVGQLQPTGLEQEFGRWAGNICQKIPYNGITAYANRIRSSARIGGGGAKQPDAHGSAWRIDKGQWDAEPALGRVAYGVPNRVDRLKALGNAVVPQVVYQIFQAIVCSGLI